MAGLLLIITILLQFNKKRKMVEANPAQGGKREAIKMELLQMANNYFDTFEQHQIVLEDPARNYVAR